MRDYHVHSNYSDGRFIPAMVGAASEAGLDAVGIADHCNVSAREGPRAARAKLGFNLDRTYERRRRGIEQVREAADVAVYDAVEMDYAPADEGRIADFLAEADFDYAVGSVHEVRGLNVQRPSNFAGMADAELDAVVDEYFDALVALAESELFDVAAHPDLIERVPPLRGRATAAHYRRAAAAFADSRTVPEINAGRALREEALVHPSPAFLDALCDRGVGLTVGTDSHAPGEIGERAAFLDGFLADRGIEPVAPPALQ
ncbi:PHP domain-containing protein [Halostella litorea]|uniref:PHP domain-containing protein n=1 Tax=Halostella litorea TaxID=2528831 RepID=UPI001091A350|nr:PHP domain-containing protein [Halostella litorea]